MSDALKKSFLYKGFKSFSIGNSIRNNETYIKTVKLSEKEFSKRPFRTDIINFLLFQLNRDTTYMEIGVRNPDDNYNHIDANVKYSVDPGIEFKENPVDFKMTSDDFFSKLGNGKILSKNIKFDVIFIDGLHLAEQVDRDIQNALKYIKDDGFIVLHDCNPPSEWHAREDFYYDYTPATGIWNGTTWKAFLKWRSSDLVESCCVDSDWGVGIFSKKQPIGKPIIPVNLFYEFKDLDKNREIYLNLIKFDELKRLIPKANDKH